MWEISPIKYDSRFDFYCIKNCYYTILKYYLIEEAPFYLFSDLSLSMFFRDHTYNGYFVDINYTPLVLSHLSNIMTYVDINFTEFLCRCLPLLRSDIPCVVSVDGYYLNFHPCFNVNHEKHALILLDVNEQERTARIHDIYLSYAYQGTIPLHVFSQAYRGEWSYLKRDGWEASKQELLKETLMYNLRSFVIRKQEQSVYSRYALGFLVHIPRLFNNQSVVDRDVLEHYHTQIIRYLSKLRFFQFYMGQALNALDNPLILKLKNETDRLIKNWNLININLLKDIYSNKMQYQYLDLLTDVRNQYTVLEKKMRSLCQYLM